MNLWHELPPGPDAPDVVYAIIEIPKGSRNKYEYHKSAGIIKLDRVLYSSLHYPGDYGLIPRTYYEDGDPLDVLVMINEPTFPGCIIEARPIGVFQMLDKGLPDDKILAVPATDPLFAGNTDIRIHLPLSSSLVVTLIAHRTGLHGLPCPRSYFMVFLITPRMRYPQVL